LIPAAQHSAVFVDPRPIGLTQPILSQIPREWKEREQRRWEFTRREGLFQPDGAFLVTRNLTAMKAQYMEQVVARVAARAGLPRRVTPHTLRRTFGSDLVNRGVRLEVVSRLLGDASTAITEKAYARLEDATVRAEMLAALVA
jgi:site-specific recombinase XerD